MAVWRKDQLFCWWCRELETAASARQWCSLKYLKTQCPPSCPCVSVRMTGCDQHIWIATLLLFPTQSHRTHLHFQFLPDIITLPFCDLPHGEIKAWTLKIWRDFRPSFYVKQHIWWTLNTTFLIFPSQAWWQRNNSCHVIARPNNPSHQTKKSTASLSGCDLGCPTARRAGRKWRGRGKGCIRIMPPPLLYSSFNHLLLLKSVLFLLRLFKCIKIFWTKDASAV